MFAKAVAQDVTWVGFLAERPEECESGLLAIASLDRRAYAGQYAGEPGDNCSRWKRHEILELVEAHDGEVERLLSACRDFFAECRGIQVAFPAVFRLERLRTFNAS